MGEFKIRREGDSGNYYWVELDQGGNVLRAGLPTHAVMTSVLQDAFDSGADTEDGPLEYEGEVVNG